MQRIIINVKGMQVLGSWGIANMAVGGVGYFAAKNDEWKYFHEMNAAFGFVNTGIATYGMLQARRQAMAKLDMNKAYIDYKRDKKILIVSIGLDAAYMGVGYALLQKGEKDHSNPNLYKGFGRSLMLQGAFLLMFDNFMLIAHQKYSGRWATILDEMRFTGNGLSYTHTF